MTSITIKEGVCYQCIDSLVDVTTASTANMLMDLARKKGFIQINQKEAFDKGFDELAIWAKPESDDLYVIDNYLVCLPRN